MNESFVKVDIKWLNVWLKIVINGIPFRFYFLAKYFETAIVSFSISSNIISK